MINIPQVMAVLKQSLPKANDADLKSAIMKAEQTIPNLTDKQLIGLVLKAYRQHQGLPAGNTGNQPQQQPSAPFSQVMGQLPQGVQ